MVVIDAEVVAVEPAGDRSSHRDRLDHRVVTSAAELGSGVAAAVGGVGVDLTTGRLIVEQRDAGRAVTSVGRRERGAGDDPSVGFDGDMGLVAVAVFAAALVHVP